MDLRKIIGGFGLGAGGDGPIKVRGSEQDSQCGVEEALEGGTGDGLFPGRGRANVRAVAFDQRFGAFGAAAVIGQAVEDIAAPFAEDGVGGRDGFYDTRHEWMVYS